MFSKRTSLARDFTTFSAIILVSVLLVSASVGFLVHYSYYRDQEPRIMEHIDVLDQELSEAFGIVAHYANFLGNKIVKHNDDSAYLKHIFSSEAFYDPNNENLWTRFNWITPDKKLWIIANDEAKEYGKSTRSFLDMTPIYPNKLMFSPVSLGIFSKKMVIPAGVGIKDPKGNFIGTINVGFDVERLTNNFEAMFRQKDLAFMLFDSNMKFVLASSNTGFSNITNILPPDALIQSLKTNIENKGIKEGLLESPVYDKQLRFTYFSGSKSYPFYWVVGEDIRVANAEYWQIIFPRIAELSFMGILFVILLYYFRQRIVRPIILLADSAREIAKGVNNPKIYYGSYQEVNLLANQLKEIQNTKLELMAAKNKVDLVNKSLEHKVKNRTIELEKALAVKTEFLNNISHEVRTPVQGITSISQGLVQHWDSSSNEKKLSLAKAVASNSQRLYSLVSNLLDFTIFNDNKIHLNIQDVDLINLIKEMILECKSLYLINKNINIIFDKHPRKALVQADSEKILQVLRNLLVNSIKFMTEGDLHISVSKTKTKTEAEESFEAITVTIKDEGMGIPESELEDIFSPFARSSLTKNKVSGAGLGLAISKEIINKHHGKIWAVNNKDKGVSVNFTLPIKSHSIAITKKTINNLKNRTNNILMIDDEPACQMSMDILLSDTGYNLISASGGISGLEYLEQHPKEVDLVLLDLMMPDMYGINVLKQIKANKAINNIPIIVQSGTNDNEEIEKAFMLGAIAYIRKPYQKSQIIDVLKDVAG